MKSPETYPGAQTVQRAVSLLKTFTDSQSELGLADLARAVSLNKTTTHRLLAALEREGLISRNPANEAYRLGPELIVLGWRALRANDLRTASHSELQLLAQETGETVTLEVLADSDTLILDEVISRHMIGGTPSIGTRWPAHATSTGKVMLAFLLDAEREAHLQSRLTKMTENTISSREALKRELAQVREQGYAIANEELEIGFVVIAGPVFNHEGQVEAAISVGGPGARMTDNRLPKIAALVKESASRISQKLGYRSEQ
ncbi:MAG: IclR family transcriptional regulator [Chloroflexi bacterium]|nr:IclR family transcriptional regulator [Chloroflexota bacterium]